MRGPRAPLPTKRGPFDLLPYLSSLIRRVCSGSGPFWTGCKLGRCEPVEARVGPVAVVVDPPCFDDAARRRQAAELVLVETGVHPVRPDTRLGLLTGRR